MMSKQGKILKLITEPNPLLHKVSQPVAPGEDLSRLMQDMLTTMHHFKGIGISAVQVGVLKRALIVDLDSAYENKVHGNEPLCMINPEIVKKSESHVKHQEGCLSLPGAFAEIERTAMITVEYTDLEGKKQSLDAENELLSICIQHEIDHLNGIVFTDHLSKLKQTMLIKKVKKFILQHDYQ